MLANIAPPLLGALLAIVGVVGLVVIAWSLPGAACVAAVLVGLLLALGPRLVAWCNA